MADFKAAQPYALSNEGGWNHVSGDDETYLGINRRFFPTWEGWAIVDSYKPLKYNEVIKDDNLNSLVNQFYKSNFWDKILGDSIDSQALATYLYDFKVNAGNNAVKCLQTTLGVVVDGGFGNATLNAVNEYSGDLLTELHKSRLEYYNKIGTNGNVKFFTGWCNRANNLYLVLS